MSDGQIEAIEQQPENPAVAQLEQMQGEAAHSLVRVEAKIDLLLSMIEQNSRQTMPGLYTMLDPLIEQQKQLEALLSEGEA